VDTRNQTTLKEYGVIHQGKQCTKKRQKLEKNVNVIIVIILIFTFVVEIIMQQHGKGLMFEDIIGNSEPVECKFCKKVIYRKRKKCAIEYYVCSACYNGV